MALERTLLAWVRTAIALLGFGFGIVQLFTALQNTPGATPARLGHSRLVGVSLVAVGTLTLVLALIQYLFGVRHLDGARFRSIAGFGQMPRFRPALIVSLVMTAVGVVMLWVLLVRFPP
jgi:putative membrane protein